MVVVHQSIQNNRVSFLDQKRKKTYSLLVRDSFFFLLAVVFVMELVEAFFLFVLFEFDLCLRDLLKAAQTVVENESGRENEMEEDKRWTREEKGNEDGWSSKRDNGFCAFVFLLFFLRKKRKERDAAHAWLGLNPILPRRL